MRKLMKDGVDLLRDMIFALADVFSEACHVAAEVGRHVDLLVSRLHGPNPKGQCDWCHRPWPCHDHMTAVRRLVKGTRERS